MKTFKYIANAFLITVVTATGLVAQVDRSKAPLPGPAPKVELGDYTTFKLDNGLTVFVVENHKLPRVIFQLSVDRDPILEGEKAGYVSIAGQLLQSGTASRSKAQLDEEVDFIGGSLSTSSTGVFASSLKKHTPALLEVMADVVLHPTFPLDELEKVRKQTLSGLAANKNDPGSIASVVGAALTYGLDHPYGEVTTENTVNAITREDVMNYYQTYFRPNVSYLIVVGDISPKEAKKLANKHFGSWESKEVPTHQYAFPKSAGGTRVAFVDRPGAVQSVIRVLNPVDLKPGGPDAIKASVANSILGGGGFMGRLMQNLREDKAYTYGARSSLSTDRLVGEFNASASVRNEVTDSAVYEFLNEMKRIRNTSPTEEEMSMVQNQMSGSFGRSLEQSQTVASFALFTAIYNLPKDYYQNYLTSLSAVNAADVKNMANKYIQPDDAIILVVGNRSEVAKKLKRFASGGEVEYYDVEGNPVKGGLEPAPEGVTAQAVLEKYVNAIGGAEKLRALKDVTINLEIELGPMKVQGIQQRKAPNMFHTSMMMNGAVMQKTTFNGKTGKETGMQGERVLAGTELEEMALTSVIAPELSYETAGYSMKINGVESLDGRNAYQLELQSPTGKKELQYYDAETGLKVKSMEFVETPGGPVTVITTYSDYKAVDGLLFPYEMEQNMGQVMKINVTGVDLNKGISDEVFNQ